MILRRDPPKRGFGKARTLLLAACIAVAACKPAVPPDVTQRQREALEGARAVDDVIQKQADDQRRRVDDAGG